jgi:signal transduction histidine kinase
VALVGERERLARDFHDTVIQDLFASGLLLQSLAARSPSENRQRIDEVIQRLDESIRQIRAVIFRLRSSGAERRSLLALIHDVIDDSARALDRQPILRSSGPVDMMATPELVEHLLPTLRESLSNVARHAHATRIEIDLDVVGAVVTLTVADNGVGYSSDAPSGNGVRNMAERARRLRGTMAITPRTPTGTTLTWSAQIDHDATPSAGVGR